MQNKAVPRPQAAIMTHLIPKIIFRNSERCFSSVIILKIEKNNFQNVLKEIIEAKNNTCFKAAAITYTV